jgi:DNA invertase Pin-like site-specific DNA recombinase
MLKIMKRIAIYTRVSTADQTTENQKLRLAEFAKSKGWLCDVYEEVMSTRKTRPVKQSVLSKLRNGEYDGVLVYKLDRWARTELILEITELNKKGVEFFSYSENLDFSSAAGKLQFQILSAFCEFERSLISERTREGLYRAKQTKVLGRPKGSKDKTERKNDGYLIREQIKRMEPNNTPPNNYPTLKVA